VFTVSLQENYALVELEQRACCYPALYAYCNRDWHGTSPSHRIIGDGNCLSLSCWSVWELEYFSMLFLYRSLLWAARRRKML